MALNSYIIWTLLLLWSPFYNASIYCAIRGMLLVASNSYIIKTFPRFVSFLQFLYFVLSGACSKWLLFATQPLSNQSSLFAYSLFFYNLNRNGKTEHNSLIIGNILTKYIRILMSISQHVLSWQQRVP